MEGIAWRRVSGPIRWEMGVSQQTQKRYVLMTIAFGVIGSLIHEWAEDTQCSIAQQVREEKREHTVWQSPSEGDEHMNGESKRMLWCDMIWIAVAWKPCLLANAFYTIWNWVVIWKKRTPTRRMPSRKQRRNCQILKGWQNRNLFVQKTLIGSRTPVLRGGFWACKSWIEQRGKSCSTKCGGSESWAAQSRRR